MTWRNTAERYGTLSISLHWITLLLIAAVYACIELRGWFPRGSEPRDALRTWHSMLGLLVFALTAVRLVVHVLGPTPRLAPRTPRWQAVAARVTHAALYLFLLAMPLLGWLLLSGEGTPVPFFGIELPALVEPDKAFAKSVEELHVTIGEFGYYLIGAHAAAALLHHYFWHDDTLRRMLPKWR